MIAIVKEVRNKFQQLLGFVAITANTNPKIKSVILVKSAISGSITLIRSPILVRFITPEVGISFKLETEILPSIEDKVVSIKQVKTDNRVSSIRCSGPRAKDML